MAEDTDQIERCRVLHKETLEVFESLEKLGDRFSDPTQRVTDAEAEQSIECLRADLDRLSSNIKLANGPDREASQTKEPPADDLLLPAIMGGLALGAVMEKLLGGDFLSRQSISPP